MTNTEVIGIILGVIVLLLAIYFAVRSQRSKKLQTKFGPEYDRLVQKEGSRTRAEAALEQRAKRMEKIHLRVLNNEELERFASLWRSEQALFVDDPRQAVAHADRLVHEVMSIRGYPMGDFEQRAADISVDHPAVVSNYRAAHAIAARDTDGKATTEDLRQAMVHYRALFEELLDLPNRPVTKETHRVEVH